MRKQALPAGHIARALMIQGTGSHVGKSLLVAGLCRIFRNRGINVAPFKSQNMALNSYVTSDGKEMGRAQVLQAAACKLEPHISMNPILLKPNGNGSSQVMLEGKLHGNVSYSDFYTKRTFLWPYVQKNFDRLAQENELVIIEGAGSPAEINLMDKEIVNMAVARMADSPVILVGDIDRGGVFASFIGTLELLAPEDRARVKGFIINKFRGDKKLLKEAVDYLQKKTEIPVLGIIDYIADLQLDDEDSVALEEISRPAAKQLPEGSVDIAVIKLPFISNYTDLEPLKTERDVNLRYVANAKEIGRPDLIIIPGSKSVVLDLKFLGDQGLDQVIIDYAHAGGFIFGICGGYQMLGKSITDVAGTESEPGTVCGGLGLIEAVTELTADKQLKQVKAETTGYGSLFFGNCEHRITGYEIHVGKTTVLSGDYLFEMTDGLTNERYYDGTMAEGLDVAGCYIHGLLDQPGFRRSFVNKIRVKKGLAPLVSEGRKRSEIIDLELDRLADLLEQQLDIEALTRIIGVNQTQVLSDLKAVEAKC